MRRVTEEEGISVSDAIAEPVLLVEDIGPVRRLTMNRPQALNALNHELSEAISAAIRDAGADDARLGRDPAGGGAGVLLRATT